MFTAPIEIVAFGNVASPSEWPLAMLKLWLAVGTNVTLQRLCVEYRAEVTHAESLGPLFRGTFGGGTPVGKRGGGKTDNLKYHDFGDL